MGVALLENHSLPGLCCWLLTPLLSEGESGARRGARPVAATTTTTPAGGDVDVAERDGDCGGELWYEVW